MKRLDNRVITHKADTQPPSGAFLIGKNTRIALIIYGAVVALFTVCKLTVFAAGTDPLSAVNNLSTFIFGLIRAIGLILLAFGIVQIGLSLKSHDPSQRANGFLTFAGGVVITFTKEILALITG
jgi:hypothetical protein